MSSLAGGRPLTAGAGVGNRRTSIDDGQAGRKAPTAINHEEKQTMTITSTTITAT